MQKLIQVYCINKRRSAESRVRVYITLKSFIINSGVTKKYTVTRRHHNIDVQRPVFKFRDEIDVNSLHCRNKITV
ncbi:MAG: hypothetical protein CVV49_18775 [Spirochaetae bacterium HGW-Spirochaetae-5]|nr:MAG: hypothetical protein CVV49_18775 [Spirochaetae bacterium HGW-Spirochaetae-5]